MDCKFVGHFISDYLDGDLPPQQAQELEMHLGDCSNCQALHADSQKMVAACRALPDYEAREELWYSLRRRLPEGGSETTITSPATRREDLLSLLQRRLVAYQRLAYAAMAVALVSLSLWVGQFLYQAPDDIDPGAAPGELAALEIRRAELHYQNAIDSLTQILDAAKPDWSEEVRAVVDRSLRTIDKSIAECQTATRRNPRNLDAETYLLAAYRKKVDFLKSVLAQPGI